MFPSKILRMVAFREAREMGTIQFFMAILAAFGSFLECTLGGHIKGKLSALEHIAARCFGY